MNDIYRVVWSATHNNWVVACELTRGYSKSGRTARRVLRRTAACSIGLTALLGQAMADGLPTGGTVTAGTGGISRNGNAMTVTQSGSRLDIDWQSFSIGQANSVTFVQPDSSAVAFNRVTGSQVSSIQGALNANGQVFLSNPNGIVFTPSAQVNVGGLVATTLGVVGQDGQYELQGTSGASVIQQGRIDVAEGGTLALVAAQIVNTGEIAAPRGNVLFGAGNKVTLDLGGPVKLRVDDGALNALIEQGGAIRVDGGRVYLTAKAADTIGTAAINHTGITQARTLGTDETGQIVLLGDMAHGTTTVAGTLDASAPGAGDGGFIETSAATVNINDGVQITTAAATGRNGLWLIDPVDYVIAPSGGDISGATLTDLLTTTSVMLATAEHTSGNGDIFVNDSVIWSANTLTLRAHRNIEINAPLYGSGTAGLILEYGLGALAAGNAATYRINAPVNLASTGSFGTRLGTDGAVQSYTIITSVNDLQDIRDGLNGRYVLGAHIDASSTASWDSGAGFAPLGVNGAEFTGIFDGLGHHIEDLTIDRANQNFVGLFGVIDGGTVRNVGLQGGSIVGQDTVGSLAGWNLGTISNVYATAAVWGEDTVGGLVGYNNGTIRNAYATGTVLGVSTVGGLVGYNISAITNVYATGAVLGSTDVGGLIGTSPAGTVSNAYWATDTSGRSSSAAGTGRTLAQLMTPSTFAGWDIDAQGGTGSVWRIYEGHSTPLLRGFLTPLTVTANDAAKTYDGLAWTGGNGLTYSLTPNASLLGTATYGGTSQDASNAGDYTLSVAGLFSNQAGYDIIFADGTLSIARATLTIDASSDTKTYDGTTTSHGTVTYSGLVAGDTLSGLTQSFDSRNAGNRAVAVDGGYVLNDGNNGNNYNVILNTASGTIDRAALSLDAVSDSKTYDGTTTASGAVQVAGLMAGDAVSGLTQSFDSRNAGNRTLTIDGGYVINDGNDGNNYIVTMNTASGTIDRAALSFDAVSDSKTYDGTTASSGVVQLSGLVAGDTVTGLTQSFDSHSAGNRTLTVNDGFVIDDGNGGDNYIVTTNTAGGIIHEMPSPPPPSVDNSSLRLQAAITDSQQEKERRRTRTAPADRPLLTVKESGIRLP